jgi:uncharacterized 2Fe-2S/4Fe-4S cluster protein (DUF4445 family)
MPFRIDLVPLGIGLEVTPGASLEAALSPYGIEFPCGGVGACRGCRVRVIEGRLAVTPEMREAFTPQELAAGWRLACLGRVESALTLEVAQWETPVLSDDSTFAFEPSEGCGIAIDLGTTTLAAQMLDLETGEILAVKTALNPQAAYGADVMSRVQVAISGGAGRLAATIREGLGELIRAMPPRKSVRLVMLAGNTVMHHLFGGLDVAPLAQAPFRTEAGGELRFTPAELGWDLPDSAAIRFLPCLGGFVGSDILAGILATGIGESDRPCALIDLGTNGEIVVGDAGGLLCASTAAGPAFEGGRIRMGMRAAHGAVAHVAACGGRVECRIIGESAPRGICGSGLVDAVAVGLELGKILPNGRLADGAREFPLAPPVSITQADIRELQLAKGAVAAGLRLLLRRRGVGVGDLAGVHLAGAFGNYLNVESARRIGMLQTPASLVLPAGNASLRGVKMALLSPSRRENWITRICSRTQHIPLASEAGFEETFVDCLAFDSHRELNI